jgi:hypothetical protein
MELFADQLRAGYVKNCSGLYILSFARNEKFQNLQILSAPFAAKALSVCTASG